MVHSAIMNWRLAKMLRTGVFMRLGNAERRTWGMVSPMMIPKAHIPELR